MRTIRGIGLLRSLYVYGAVHHVWMLLGLGGSLCKRTLMSSASMPGTAFLSFSALSGLSCACPRNSCMHAASMVTKCKYTARQLCDAATFAGDVSKELAWHVYVFVNPISFAIWSKLLPVAFFRLRRRLVRSCSSCSRTDDMRMPVTL